MASASSTLRAGKQVSDPGREIGLESVPGEAVVARIWIREKQRSGCPGIDGVGVHRAERMVVTFASGVLGFVEFAVPGSAGRYWRRFSGTIEKGSVVMW